MQNFWNNNHKYIIRIKRTIVTVALGPFGPSLTPADDFLAAIHQTLDLGVVPIELFIIVPHEKLLLAPRPGHG